MIFILNRIFITISKKREFNDFSFKAGNVHFWYDRVKKNSYIRDTEKSSTARAKIKS